MGSFKIFCIRKVRYVFISLPPREGKKTFVIHIVITNSNILPPLSFFPHIHEMQQYFDFKRTEEDIAILFLLNIDVYIVVLSEMDLLVHCNLYMR